MTVSIFYTAVHLTGVSKNDFFIAHLSACPNNTQMEHYILKTKALVHVNHLLGTLILVRK
jgi:hypothetical protein